MNANDLDGLPDWESLSDHDRAAALWHGQCAEREGYDYATIHYPASFSDDPRLTALSPAAASTHARLLYYQAIERISCDEFQDLLDLARENASPRRPGGAYLDSPAASSSGLRPLLTSAEISQLYTEISSELDAALPDGWSRQEPEFARPGRAVAAMRVHGDFQAHIGTSVALTGHGGEWCWWARVMLPSGLQRALGSGLAHSAAGAFAQADAAWIGYWARNPESPELVNPVVREPVSPPVPPHTRQHVPH